MIVTHAMDHCESTMRQWRKPAFMASDMANLTYNAYHIPYGEGGEETVTLTLGQFAVSIGVDTVPMASMAWTA